MSKLARVIATIEGFGVPGAQPTRKHNPGDLRHSPNSEHPGGPTHADDIGTIDTDEHGWADLERQLALDAARGLTLYQFVYGDPERGIAGYAPPNENDSRRYLLSITNALGVIDATPLAEALRIA